MLNTSNTQYLPTVKVLEPTELGHLTIRDKLFVPNGVHYRGVLLYKLSETGGGKGLGTGLVASLTSLPAMQW